MKYRFKHIKNGQLGDGLAVLTIRNGVCQAGTPDEQALAERHGGQLVAPKKQKRRVKAEEDK